MGTGLSGGTGSGRGSGSCGFGTGVGNGLGLGSGSGRGVWVMVLLARGGPCKTAASGYGAVAAAFFPITHSSNHSRLRFIASSMSFGSWMPCGVRGYVTIFTGTLRRLSAPYNS